MTGAVPELELPVAVDSHAPPGLSYDVVDVFTDTAFAGNPLAVVLGADALTGEQMQALARELNLSETVFPVAATVPGADYRLRIFTPSVELPFAGHPSVGAAWVLARRGRLGADATEVVQECGAGLLPLSLRRDEAGGVTSVELTGGEPAAGEPLDPAPLLAACGLTAADLDRAGPPRRCGAGLPFVYLPVRPDAVARAAPDLAALRGGVTAGAGGLCVVSWSTADRTAHARVFAPGVGVGEDPATGSAAVGLGVWLAASGLLAEGETSYVVSQGTEVGRPSRLDGAVVVRDGTAVQCRVAGAVVPVARGKITVP